MKDPGLFLLTDTLSAHSVLPHQLYIDQLQFTAVTYLFFYFSQNLRVRVHQVILVPEDKNSVLSLIPRHMHLNIYLSIVLFQIFPPKDLTNVYILLITKSENFRSELKSDSISHCYKTSNQ